VQAQRFHDGFAAQLDLQVEQVFERAVGEINFAVAVEQQQTFEHGIEKHLLLRLRVNGRLLLPSAGVLHFRVNLLPLAAEFLPPRKMNGHRRCERKDEEKKPHGNYLATDETQMKHRFLFKRCTKELFHL
jgi:hypothetical protein